MWLLIGDLACFHLMHGLSIFCHFWQIADHTHIFSLPLPHKLWLHMGKHSLPQECNKLQPTPHTHSQDSRTEFLHMVSHPVLEECCYLVHACVFEWCLKTVNLDGPEKVLSPVVSASNEHCENGGSLCWGQSRVSRLRGLYALLLSVFSIHISTLNLPFEQLALEFKAFLCLFVIKLLPLKSFGVQIHFLFIRCPAMIGEVQVEFNKLLL